MIAHAHPTVPSSCCSSYCCTILNGYVVTDLDSWILHHTTIEHMLW